jgi:hypothetical protein
MANSEHEEILNQGVEMWNQWREEQEDWDLILPDLNGIDFSGVDFSDVNFSNTDLSGSNLSGCNLSNANLVNANLSRANLSNANLTKSTLMSTNFNNTDFNNTNLKFASIGWTIFVNVDLSTTKGLYTIKHYLPSSIGIDTIYRSKGNISKTFLRKAGVPQSIIEQIPALIGSLNPIDYYSCFISYSSKDQDFADRIVCASAIKFDLALMNRFVFTISCYLSFQDTRLLANGSSMK